MALFKRICYARFPLSGLLNSHAYSCRFSSVDSSGKDSADSIIKSQTNVAIPETPARKLPWVTSLTDPLCASKTAFKDHQRSFTYQDIASLAYAYHMKLEEDFRVEKTIKPQSKTLHKKRIAIFTPHDVSFVIALWSTWLSGGVAVPLGLTNPDARLEHFLKNSDTSVILCSKETQERASVVAKACGAEILPVSSSLSNFESKDPKEIRDAILPLAPSAEDSALILYTSGTTGQPKGVLWRHDALAGQAEAMINSWGWTLSDTLLHVLPLYHFHGLINCLLTPLSCGAAVFMDETFKAETVWQQILSSQKERVNVFMAVPTIYVKLLEYHSQHKAHMPSEENIKEICQQKMRLMVSGSAPLPESVFNSWEQLTGHRLLERYGMTETGMILSNPLHGKRIRGTVGKPLPGVQVRIVKPKEEILVPAAAEDAQKKKSFLGLKSKKDNGSVKTPEALNTAALPTVPKDTHPVSNSEITMGELQVLGTNVFHCYWNNEKATEDSFTNDGWFITGDTAEIKDGVYRLLGRTSTEIIKSGGFKLSAIDIESRISEHPEVAECAVFGVPDPVWGEKVVALVKLVPTTSMKFDEDELQQIISTWVADAMPAYAAPKELRIVDEIPRNDMGKVNKKELIKSYEPVLPAA